MSRRKLDAELETVGSLLATLIYWGERHGRQALWAIAIALVAALFVVALADAIAYERFR